MDRRLGILAPLSLDDVDVAEEMATLIKSGKGAVLPTGIDGKVTNRAPEPCLMSMLTSKQ